MKIKSIIVDDEKHARENLAGILAQHCPNVLVLVEANSVESAINLIRKEKSDLVFLNIEMPKAIRFSVADYILKPINYKDLKFAVENVVKRIQLKEKNERIKELQRNIQRPENPRIGLPTGDRIEFIDVKKIIHCKGEGNYTHIYLEENKHLLVAKTLVEFEELLQEFAFIRTHKSHLVNLLHLNSYVKTDGGMLQLSNGEKVAVSRRRKEQVQKMLKTKTI
ncbi:LytTR family DNA-binding domain-containing protein [Draconibacterium sp.]|nr:LytTR family DNA-binding domain-containing protein [Draconibacterium sp.]